MRVLLDNASLPFNLQTNPSFNLAHSIILNQTAGHSDQEVRGYNRETRSQYWESAARVLPSPKSRLQFSSLLSYMIILMSCKQSWCFTFLLVFVPYLWFHSPNIQLPQVGLQGGGRICIQGSSAHFTHCCMPVILDTVLCSSWQDLHWRTPSQKPGYSKLMHTI